MPNKKTKGPGKPGPITKKERALLDFIGQFESKGGDYNILYGGYDGETDKPLTEMTIAEVLKLQENMKSSGSSAVGAHQIINKTLKEEIKKQGVTKDSLFTPELQDKIILGRLKTMRGFDKFLEGKDDTDIFMKNLSKEFASFPNPETGKSYYDGDDVGNKSLVGVDEVRNKLNAIRDTVINDEIREYEDDPYVAGTASFVNEDFILNNSELNDEEKEELLKLNEEAGLQPDTIERLSSGKSLLSPGLSDYLKPTQAPKKDVDLTALEINSRNDVIDAAKLKETESFPKDFKLLPTSKDSKFAKGGKPEVAKKKEEEVPDLTKSTKENRQAWKERYGSDTMYFNNYLNKKDYNSKKDLRTIISEAAQSQGVDPNYLFSTLMTEGLDTYEFSDTIDKGYKEYVAEGNSDTMTKDDYAKIYTRVVGVNHLGLDTLGDVKDSLIKDGYLDKEFFKKGVNLSGFVNEKNEDTISGNFDNLSKATKASAAFIKRENDNLQKYLDKNDIDLTPKQKMFFQSVSYNAGPGNAHKMIDSYKDKGYLADDKFIQTRPNESWKDVHTNAKRRVGSMLGLHEQGLLPSTTLTKQQRETQEAIEAPNRHSVVDINPDITMNTTFNDGGLLNKFNTGGSHEENQLGGIPLSTNPEGGQNLVEEGETQMGDYIFPKDTKLDKKTAKRVGLEQYAGKPMAEISERINASIVDRPFDKVAVKTAEGLLNKLMMANEMIRPETPDSPDKMFLPGGLAEALSGATETIGGLQGAEAAGGVSPAGVVGAVGTVAEFGNDLFGDPAKNIDVNSTTQTEDLDMASHTLGKGVKGAMAGGSIVPGIGHAVGGAVGLVSGIVGGNKMQDKIDKAQNNFVHMNNKKLRKGNMNAGEANRLAATGGLLATELAGRKTTPVNSNNYPIINLPRQKEGMSEEQFADNTDSYRRKMQLTPDQLTGFQDQRASDQQYKQDKEAHYASTYKDWRAGSTGNTQHSKLSASDPMYQDFWKTTKANYGKTNPRPINDTVMEYRNSGPGMSSERSVKFKPGGKQNTKEKITGFLDNNLDDFMRLAPIARNFLKEKEDAEVTNFGEIDNRYKKFKFDENNLLNRIKDASGNARSAATEASGGDLASLRNNIRAIHTNELRGVSDALNQDTLREAEENRMEQSFNKDTDVRNQAIRMQETIANEQNRAAANNANDAMRNAAWEDLGLLGRENKLAGILENTTGYGVDGDKVTAEDKIGWFTKALGWGENLLNKKDKLNRNGGFLATEKGGLSDFEDFLKQKYS